WDDNRITIDGSTALSFSEDVGKRFEAYGWNVVRVGDDATLDDYERAARAAMAETFRPTLVACRTHIGYGSPHKQDTAKAHGEALGEEEVRLTKERYGWPTEPAFLVPDDVAEHMREAAGRGDALVAEW